jgi:lipoprotein NlpD
VSEGETIGTIAAKYEMTRSDLIRLNKLTQPYQLYNGQRLIIIPKVENTADFVDTVTEATTEVEEAAMARDAATAPDEQTDATMTASDQVQLGQTQLAVSNYIWPIANGRSKITQRFGENDVEGIVLDTSVGTPVKAIADGTVIISGTPSGEAAAYGLTVIIKHSNLNMISIYSNLKETNVAEQQKIKQGDQIGKTGQSGQIARKPQLYFEMNDLSEKKRKAVDPEKLLPQ